MSEPKHKAHEKEDYGGTGKTRRKPASQPQEGAAPVHRGEENEAALADVGGAVPGAKRRRDEERGG